MKKSISLLLCLLLAAFTLSAQQNLYVIDNETIESFDGSQLKGKTIKDYKITTKGSGRRAVTVHAITTAPSLKSLLSGRMDTLKLKDLNFRPDSSFLSASGVKVVSNTSKKIVYVIDGEKCEDLSTIHSIAPGDIASITVLKDGSAQQLKYGGKDVSVILVTTKKSKETMSELLKMLPGAKVDAEGNVTVNGQPVTTITINGRNYSVKP